MLVEPVLAVHQDVVCGLIELGGVAGVVGVVGAAGPVVARRGELQPRGLGVLAEGVGHEGEGAKPDLVHVGIEVVGRAFSEAEDEVGVVARAGPRLHVELNLHQALQHRGVVAHVDVVLTLHAEGGDVAEQLQPLASVVAYLHAAYPIITVAVAVHAVVVVMGQYLIERAHMRGQGVVASGAVVNRVADEVAVKRQYVQMAVDVVSHLKMVGVGSRFATALGHADGHFVVAEARGRPEAIVIAVVRVVGIVGVEADLLSVDACSDIRELDDLGVLDVGRDDDHDGVNLIQIDLCPFIRAA